MEAPAARRLLKAANAETAEPAGIKILKILVMVNTRKASHVKKAISPKPSTDGGGRAPAYVWFFHEHKWKQRYDPSVRRQATSVKHQAPIFRKLQALGDKRQAPGSKLQASSHKLQAP